MTLVRKASQGGGVHIDPGTYHIRCMDAREDHLDNSQFGSGDVIRFDLEAVDMVMPDGNPVQLDAIANDRLTPKSKLWGWLEAFGLKVEVGSDIDIDDVVGREAYAVVVDKASEQGGVFSKVDNLIPLPKTGARSMPGAAPPLEVVRSDGSVNLIAFWKALDAAGITRLHLQEAYGMDEQGLRSHIASLDGDAILELLRSVGANV